MASKFTLTDAQRRLLDIVFYVENGTFTPQEAFSELTDLKQDAASAGLQFKAEYTLEDFQKLRSDYMSTYESSVEFVESEPYIESSSY
jgi:hypothetical protein